MTTLNVPPNLPLSLYLFKQCKLWIWDFDDTLINTDTYYKKDMTPATIQERTDTELTNEIPQWRYFRDLVNYLITNGRYVAIASFGTLEIIRAYMNRIMGFNQKIFTDKNIIAPRYAQRNIGRYTQPPNKNEYIYTLMRIYRVQDFKRVVLFDDNSSNIADAIAIGVIGVQIATPGNGDKDTNKMYFGPWIMTLFDERIATTCGEEKYQNKTYTGIASKEPYTALAYDNKDIEFGNGVRARDNYFMEPYILGVDDSVIYRTPAFGTGIGNRKVNAQPQFRWNTLSAGNNVPKWTNGNYINIPGLVDTEGYWTVKELKNDFRDIRDRKGIKDKNETMNDTITHNENIYKHLEQIEQLEHFKNNNIDDCNICNSKYTSWIILILLIICSIMLIMIINC